MSDIRAAARVDTVYFSKQIVDEGPRFKVRIALLC